MRYNIEAASARPDTAERLAILTHHAYAYLGDQNPVPETDIDVKAKEIYKRLSNDSSDAPAYLAATEGRGAVKQVLGFVKTGPWRYGDRAPFVPIPDALPGSDKLRKMTAKALLHARPADGIHVLAVDAALKDNGIGTELLEAAEERSRTRLMRAAVHENNLELREWFLRQGYRDTERVGTVALSKTVSLPHRLFENTLHPLDTKADEPL